MRRGLVLFIIAASVWSVKTNLEDDDENVIEALDYEYYKKSRDPEVARNCRTDVMISYGLGGDSPTLAFPNSYCPNVKQNCCGPRDQDRLPRLWKTISKRIAIHNKIVLLIYKYILGLGKKWDKLASKVSQAWENRANIREGAGEDKGDKKEEGTITYKAEKHCAEAADRILSLGFGERAKVEFYYRQLSERAQFLHNTRRGMYCVFCSVEGQKAVSNIWPIFSWLYKDRVYYNKEFCYTLVQFSFRISYELSKTYNYYLKDLLKVTTCVKIEGPKEDKENQKQGVISPAVLEYMIKNPLRLKHKTRFELCDLAEGSNFMVFEKCEYWCQMWHPTKPSNLFDGSTLQMERLFQYLSSFEPVLGGTANLFRGDHVKLKRDINKVLEVRYKAKTFMKSISGYMDLTEYKSDFVWFGPSVNPMEVGKGSTLEFEYMSARVLGLLFFAVFALLA